MKKTLTEKTFQLKSIIHSEDPKWIWYKSYLAFIDIMRFITSHQLNKQQIWDNALKFEEYINGYVKCSPDEPCGQKFKGKESVLKWENEQIYLTTVSCCHGLVRDHIQNIADQYLFYDFATEFLNLNISKPEAVMPHASRRTLLKAYSEWTPDFKKNKGFYLWGPPGIGKTRMMIAFANRIAIKYPQLKIIFINSQNLIHKFKQANGFNATPAVLKTREQIINVDILIIDDFGGEKWNAWLRDEIYYDLINARYINQQYTFFTSNYDWEKLFWILRQASMPQEPSSIATTKAKRLIQRIQALNNDFGLKIFNNNNNKF